VKQVLLASALLALAACKPAAGPALTSTVTPIDIAAETRALEAVSDALQHGDRATMLMLFFDDAEMLPPGGPVTGIEAIRNLYGGSERDPGVSFTRSRISMAASADLAVERGDWHAEGAGGQYVMVWKKDPAGQWKVLYDISTDAPPPIPPH
jgi:ketosteroid isomerase-like protein